MMSSFNRIAAVGALAAGIALSANAAMAQAKGKCVLAGGTATMITEDLAKFMAEAALKNSISGMGATASGKIAMTCKPETGLSNCTARQRACK